MRFRILGALEVSDGTDRLALGGPKQRLVLAHLILRANTVTSADVLIDQTWGDDPPLAARASLHSYISHLRRVLGADRLTRRSSGYLLHAAADEIDSQQFEELAAHGRRNLATDPAIAARHLRAALELWRGDPLADLADEPSLQGEIGRLSEMRTAVSESWVEAELAMGRHVEVLSVLEPLQRENPLRERLAAHLMVALYRAGRQADALEAYRRLRRALDEELGVDPSPDLEVLQRRLLNHDPTLELRGLPLRGYRLIEPIDSGPLGVFHRAVEPQTEREVSILVIGSPKANAPDFIRRFDADAQGVARLEHPHIIPLIDWWREPDTAYLVWRRSPGATLADRLASGDPSLEEALRWTEQVGSAIAAAHRRGVTRMHLSPPSIVVDDEGNAYLRDFAIGLGPAAGSLLAIPELADVLAFANLVDSLLERAGGDVAEDARSVLRRVAPEADGDRPPSPTMIVDAMRRTLAPSLGPAVLGADQEPERNPYKGLRAFSQADAGDFFGREMLVGRLIDRLRESTEASRLLALVGPSGSGKSSVVAAGLLPALRTGAVDGSERWLVTTMTPGAHPFEQLERSLLSVAVDASGSSTGRLDAGDGLRTAIERALPPATELLLVIDQFEELFTLVPDVTVRQRFLDMLADAIAEPTCRLRVVIMLRADFFDRPLRHARFGGQLAARLEAIPPLTPEELERVVAVPARRVGLRLERGLVARVIAEMGARPGALPLLQYALSELWERRDGSRLSLSAYETAGGIAGAVARRAEELVTQLDEDGREAAQRLFLSLVEPGDGAPDTGRRVLRAHLAALSAGGGDIESLIERFARYRLLLLDRDAGTRGPTVELAHEALLRAWPRLQRWVDEARDDLRDHRRLAAAGAQWVESGRDPSFLLTGRRLEQADDWAASTLIGLSRAEEQYLSASREQRRRGEAEETARLAHEAELERRSLTRLRGLVAVLGLGALLAGGLSLFALAESARAEREARVATARELAAASVANVSVDPERSMLLALEAVHATRSADGTVLREAEDALRRAVAASRLVLRVPDIGGLLAWESTTDRYVTEGPENSGMIDIRSVAEGGSVLPPWRAHGVDVNDVALSPDASMLLTTGDDGFAVVWSVEDGAELSRQEAHSRDQVWGAAFNPDGTLAAAVWKQEQLLLTWRPATAEVVHRLTLDGRPKGVSFSPGGDRVAVSLEDPGEVLIVDLASAEILEVLEHGERVEAAEWSPDGRWIATAGRAPALRLWDMSAPDPRPVTPAAHNGEALGVEWSADGRLATAGSDGTAKVWDVAEGVVSEVLSLSGDDTSLGLIGLAFSADGTYLMTGATFITGMQVWHVGPAGERELANVPATPGETGAVTIGPDGSLYTSSGSGAITATNVSTGAGRPMLAGDDLAWDIEVSPDGTLVAIAGGEDNVAYVINAKNGLREFTVAHDGPVKAVSWSPDGSLLATGGARGQIRIVDLLGDPVADLGDDPRSEVLELEFSPDGTHLAAAREDPDGVPEASWVSIWDHERREVVMTLQVLALDIAFNSTGTLLAAAGREPDVTVWRVATGQLEYRLAGQATQLWGVAWSHDDSRIAAGGFDGLIRLWDVKRRLETLTLRGHAAPVNDVAFSPDGRQLASTSPDGTARAWALDIDDLLELAVARLHRPLTDDECRQFLHLEGCPEP